MWELNDYTNGKNKGYLTLTLNGRKVCDAFPYAREADAEWVRAQMRLIFERMIKANVPDAGEKQGACPKRVQP